MNESTRLPTRKNIRLCEYDYSQEGYYFITICSHNQRNIFGETHVTDDGGGIGDDRDVNDGNNNDNDRDDVGQGLCPCRPSPSHTSTPSCNLSNIGKIIDHEIRQLTTRFSNIETTKYVIMPNHIHMLLRISGGVAGRKIWQFRFHDRVVRNEAEFLRIWQYIDDNPARWVADCYYLGE